MYNLKRRSDSSLCNKYIDGTLEKEWTLEKISQKMCEMKYLYDYCNLVNIMHSISYDKIREWKEYNPNNTIMGPRFEIAKQIALEKSGSFPIVWPWNYKIKDDRKILLSKLFDELSLVPKKNGFLGGYIFLKKKKEYKKIFCKDEDEDEVDVVC
jgi:ribosomal protein S8